MFAIDITACAPAGALCADCGCSCAGETVVIDYQPGPLGGMLATYRHLHSDDCRAAHERSVAYWHGGKTMDTQLDLFTNQRAGEYPIPPGATSCPCRSCGQEIVFTRTAAGRFIPLSLATVEERDGVRYALVHFADCPHAKDWSRKR